MTIKREVFARLGSACREDAILATNTSTLDVDEIAAAAPRPERTLGMHFFSPAHVMKLLEIVRGRLTSSETLGTAVALAERMGKVPVVVGNCDGFVGNRMLHKYRREAELLLESGATPAQVDGALQEFGFAMGPFAVADLAGVDIGWRAKQERLKKAPSPFRLSNIPDLLVAAGRLGQKTGAGYYRYEPSSRKPVPDLFVDEIIKGERQRLGIPPREISNDEIVQRCVYALINEGARILDEGVAASAADIDTIWLTGYGFPAARGGPMTYADAVGIDVVRAAIRRFAKDDPSFWEPVL
jgi:3-hydroxyacyl-CoA dehydrogenase